MLRAGGHAQAERVNKSWPDVAECLVRLLEPDRHTGRACQELTASSAFWASGQEVVEKVGAGPEVAAGAGAAAGVGARSADRFRLKETGKAARGAAPGRQGQQGAQRR